MASSTAAPPKITYPIHEKYGEKYTFFNQQPVGKGAYSVVYRGRTESGRVVAVKTACKKVEIQAILVEIEILKKLRGSPNIVQFIGSVHTKMAPGEVTPETISFAMEFAKGSLESEMKRPENIRGLPADMLIDLVVDCSSALSALHERNIAHRDIKHMNILLFPGTPTRGRRSTNLFKLCDMGCGKELLESSKNEMRTLVGTPKLLHPFLAKELVNQDKRSWKTKSAYTPEQCDLWSLGCTLYFCATGRLPFEYERSHHRVYHEAGVALTQNPNAIAMLLKTKDQGYEFEPVTELPAKFTRYPKWLVCTMTYLLRNFFHEPSIDYYSKVAVAMRDGKRRTFVSVDQMCIVEHTDMSNVGFTLPTISSCLGYPDNTDLTLLSSTSSEYVESNRISVDGLPDDIYLVVPERKEVNIRKILARNIEYREDEDMHDRRLADVRIKKCYEGLSMLTETDEYRDLFDRVATILSTQFSLLVKELSQFERVQTTSRFAVYVDMASVPMMLLDGANQQTKSISERCVQQARQAREELERHAQVAMNIESMAKQLAKDAENLRLDDIDLPGIREEIESYYCDDKSEILATRVYTQQLVEQCFNRRNHIMEQILKSPDRTKKSKLNEAMYLAASWNQLRKDYQRLQNTISECVDLLERPFQEMKEVVNRCLTEQGHSRNSMEKSMHYLAPEFRENQQRMKKTTKACRKLISELNQEIEQLGFVRMGDTLIQADPSTRRSEDVESENDGTLKKPEDEKQEEKENHHHQLHILKPSIQVCSSEPITSSILSNGDASSPSFESTSSLPKAGSNYFQAVYQYFAKQPTSS